MPEQTIVIDNQISGIVTYPENSDSSSDAQFPAVLMLHGFGSDKNEVNGFYRGIASELAANNIISLRIDFRGYGNSVGNPENFTVNDMVLDAVKAFHHLTALPVDKMKLGVIGFSLGAAIAMLLSQQTTLRALALISPAYNLSQDFSRFLGADMMKRLAECQDFIEVDLQWRKINISKSFFESIRACNMAPAVSALTGNLLCIAGENDFSAANTRAIIQASPSTKKTLEIIPNADHAFNMSGLPPVATKAAQWMSFFLKDQSSDTGNAAANATVLSQ